MKLGPVQSTASADVQLTEEQKNAKKQAYHARMGRIDVIIGPTVIAAMVGYCVTMAYMYYKGQVDVQQNYPYLDF